MSKVLTIGHSSHPIERFIGLLVSNRVTAVADVRSSPYSRFNPQFNREVLKRSLAEREIGYVFLGAELGARSDDPSCYVDGKVQYNRIAESQGFRAGIARVIEGSRKHHVAMMCAEKDPLDCHRTILVARELVARGVEVLHILADGSQEAHYDAMERLLVILGMPAHDMFKTSERIVQDAYDVQGQRIAYDRNEQAQKTMEGEEGEAQS